MPPPQDPQQVARTELAHGRQVVTVRYPDGDAELPAPDWPFASWLMDAPPRAHAELAMVRARTEAEAKFGHELLVLLHRELAPAAPELTPDSAPPRPASPPDELDDFSLPSERPPLEEEDAP